MRRYSAALPTINKLPFTISLVSSFSQIPALSVFKTIPKHDNKVLGSVSKHRCKAEPSLQALDMYFFFFFLNDGYESPCGSSVRKEHSNTDPFQ